MFEYIILYSKSQEILKKQICKIYRSPDEKALPAVAFLLSERKRGIREID